MSGVRSDRDEGLEGGDEADSVTHPHQMAATQRRRATFRSRHIFSLSSFQMFPCPHQWPQTCPARLSSIRNQSMAPSIGRRGPVCIAEAVIGVPAH